MPSDPDVLAPRPPSPLTEVVEPALERRGLRLTLKRDDLIHPELPGNKWRKLAPNLRAAVRADSQTLLTFGGAYSNHLRATATAGRLLGLRTIGVVRGDELAHRPLNPSLARCVADGMRLWFVSRATYRRRADPAYHHELRDLFGEVFLVPEGGSNALAVEGCAALGRELRGRTDVVVVPCGTGGTLAGLAAGLGPGQRAIGVSVLRGDFLTAEVRGLQRAAFGGERGDWSLEDRFHCGGYARGTPELEEFAADFEHRHGLPPLDRVYTAKALLATVRLAEEGAFAAGGRVTAVLTG
ncbi:pyridoxal-phosphate dependent enzyme [Streptomyces sp. AJS327]|uniref:1-aminocyclopropane-1-carboxylate deaminase/D-cysteine desulfhydrase n=1 Tax=Streptomyces sp. AJS327 TaxID=2545265 RepID=UPI0015DFC765|nr:pyridoxal-phosphate dependent enzyme [Streptomyces sp. AJS327]MBA0051521.1 pyridoxal-phosphate dependent enzyme [Streptomyces sp. AJS327]